MVYELGQTITAIPPSFFLTFSPCDASTFGTALSVVSSADTFLPIT